MKKSAFTLIELLVVIAIIALLAGIALPVFNQVLERGKATQDLSNLRQLGIGSTAYLSDNNDQTFTVTGNPAGWPAALESKYVPNWKAFISPFDKNATAGTKSDGSDAQVSYGINSYILGVSSPPDKFDGNTTKYVSPSQLIFLAPNIVNDTTQIKFTAGLGNTNVAVPVPGGMVTDRTKFLGTHAKRSLIDVLYADSHVSSITYIEFTTVTGTPGRSRWEPVFSPN